MAKPATLPWRKISRALAIALTLLLGLAVAFPAYAADADAAKATPPAADPAKATQPATGDIDAERLFGAIVKIATRAIPGARSSDSLISWPRSPLADCRVPE